MAEIIVTAVGYSRVPMDRHGQPYGLPTPDHREPSRRGACGATRSARPNCTGALNPRTGLPRRQGQGWPKATAQRPGLDAAEGAYALAKGLAGGLPTPRASGGEDGVRGKAPRFSGAVQRACARESPRLRGRGVRSGA